MNKNPFVYAQGERIKIVSKQEKQIKSLYLDVLKEIRKDINRTIGKETNYAVVKRMQLNALKDELIMYITEADKQTQGIVESNMGNMVLSVIENNNSFIHNMGFKNITTNPIFKQNVVERIISGKLYGNQWSLSTAVWGDNALKRAEINSIVAKGILKNKSLYDVAKDLERYVNPNARKDFKWSNLYPGSRKKIDYNAQRLARTMISHAYEESFVALTKDNPFIEAYQWITSGGDRVCPLCIDRETLDQFGLGPGIFPKDSLPLDHPNGMCTFDIVVTMSDEEIQNAIDDWYMDEGDAEMNRRIDDYINSL